MELNQTPSNSIAVYNKTMTSSTAEGKPFVFNPEIEQSVTVSDDGDYVPRYVTKRYRKDIKNFEVRSTDIFVITWPRSGTTWTQYMLTQIVHGHSFTDEHILPESNFFLEYPRDIQNWDTSEGLYKVADRSPSPRFLKSHLQMDYLPTDLFTKKPKLIYVARNPKDATVSYYNFNEMFSLFPNYRDWADFYEHSIRGYVPYGDWFSHVLPWWELRHEPNVLFLKYEDSIKDIKGTVRSISEFLGKPLSTEELNEISRRSTFTEMSRNSKANLDLMNHPFFETVKNGKEQKFMRKGTIGDWKNYFTSAQNDHFDALYRSKMDGSSLNFDFELEK